jgi:hypothetical protein
MLVVDTSTGLGVTALSMAQQLRNIGQIVALNADDMFFRSVELNGNLLSNYLKEELENSSIPFNFV